MSFFISDAYAEAAPAAQQGDPMMSMLFFLGMIAIFYFILIRLQQKKAKEHRNMVAALSQSMKSNTAGVLPFGDGIMLREFTCVIRKMSQPYSSE